MASTNPEEWVITNKKEFPKWITKTFPANKKQQKTVSSCDVKTERLALFPHQKFVRDYMQHKSPYRGILLYHGLGVGKTCASIAVAEIMNNHRDVMVLLPASLQMNYRNEIMKCGNTKFAINQHWKFNPTKKHTDAARKQNIDPSIVKKAKGYWSFENDKAPNFHTKSSLEKQQIRTQINDSISKKYEFINYNGLTLKKFKEMTKDKNIFDNKLVIIDEAHLFISTVVNRSTLSTEVYKDLLHAKNLKIVLLTGTPIINYPNEIAYTFNLLNGLNKVYRIYFNDNFYNKLYLEKSKLIESFNIKDKSGHRSIELNLTPFGFEKNLQQMLVYKGDSRTDEEKMDIIIKDLKASGVVLSKYSDKKTYFMESFPLFPTNKTEFDDLFVNYNDNSTKNDELFMRRMMGIVSYYESSDTSLYPTNLGVVQEELEFSDHQFGKYAQVRDSEIKKEKNMKKFNKDATDLFSKNGVYKTFSRTLCNFAFPDQIERPFPKKRISFMESEMDVDEDFMNDVKEYEQEMNTRITAKKTYEKNVMEALHKLNDQRDHFLNDENLKIYSPKFDRIMSNIKKTNGNVLVYSQFKTLEGLGILGLCLKARGYAEMKISLDKDNNIQIDVAEEDYKKPKYAVFSTDRDVANVILNIFNSDMNALGKETVAKLKQMYDFDDVEPNNLHGELIKILMITQSGSAGISLKNVRQVHIVEPYWNKSRIDQVIGRANRTCSHIDLPESERNFKVFMYRMKMTGKQNKKSVYIRSTDNEKTTDQSIYELAQKKDAITSKILMNIKTAAVDCALNKNNMGLKYECFAYPLDVDGFEKAYYEDIKDDKDSVVDQQRVKQIRVKPFKVTIEGVSYIWLQNTNELFNYELYKNTGTLDKIGMLENKKDGYYKITLFKNK
jgi:hypothetical protein